jgi:acetyltransferase-like isoleucine patch superfamily enzyme
MRDRLKAYVATQASGGWPYVKQEVLTSLLSWVPSLPGIALRGVVYRTLLRSSGMPAIDSQVRLKYTENIRLGRNVYLDHGVYLHACPNGIEIGDDSFVMHGAVLHVYNFRGMPQAGISIGKRCIVGELSVIRGQGGVTIGDDVLIAPQVQILAVEHNVHTTRVPIMEQGITGRGILIEDGAWLGAGAIITDGVHIGRNAVIGAGAVVTRDIPAGSIAVGVPARVVRKIDDVAPPLDVAPPITRTSGSSRPTATPQRARGRQ